MHRTTTLLMLGMGAGVLGCGMAEGQEYVIVDTGQVDCYDDVTEVACPGAGADFFGQDAHYAGLGPRYRDNGDGTITDLVTGLMWQQTPDLDNKSTFAEAMAGAETFDLAGYDDWRLPSIKELYSLIDFRGHTGMNTAESTPYLDTTYFDFAYGDESAGERYIDAQYWSSTEYVGLTMGGDPTVFGVNFADGRIKGYPRDTGPGGAPFTEFVRYVRGNPNYGANQFVDQGNGAVLDAATGLVWMQTDSGAAMDWEAALDYCTSLDLAGIDDWRLPNAKELQSIVDYSRAPDAGDPAQQGPAIDPVFQMTGAESYFWTSTTHLDGPTAGWAAYVCFGRAFGWMEQPPGSGNHVFTNVHGAGAQRSDPKSGDPDDYPYGHGPQGDDVRIFNYVRCVRGCSSAAGDIDCDGEVTSADAQTFSTQLSGPGVTAPPAGATPEAFCKADLDDDGDVDLRDFGTLLASLGG